MDSYKIQEINDKNVWEEFLLKQNEKSFLQSWNFGEMNGKMGRKIFRLGVFNNGNILCGICLAIKVVAKRGTYLHIPYGPVIDFSNENLFKELIAYLKNLAKIEKANFLRINPLLIKNNDNLKFFKKLNFRDAPVHLVNPEISWIKDVSESEENIMKNFRKETRYEINKSEKLGVKITKSNSEDFLKTFYDIHLDTVKRHHFVPYSFDFLKNEVDIFGKDNQLLIFQADYENKPIASAIIVFYGSEASYHHAASLSEYNRIPASYLIQWEVMKEAKKRNCKTYNFWGIVEDKPNHPWAGLSLFKKKFGGEKKEYLHVQDLPLNYKYWFNWIIEKLRRIRRGY